MNSYLNCSILFCPRKIYKPYNAILGNLNWTVIICVPLLQIAVVFAIKSQANGLIFPRRVSSNHQLCTYLPNTMYLECEILVCFD